MLSMPSADASAQGELFEAPPPAALPDGLVLRADFIDAAEEASLVEVITALPLAEARYRGFTARRRVASYGTQYDFDDLRLTAGLPLPEALLPLRARAAALIGAAPGDFTNVLVAEYRPGTPLGWHRDVPDFETVVGISLGGVARMRLRRWPAVNPKKTDVLSLALPPRSAYVLSGEARWRWQHSIAPTTVQRWSITFRTPRVRLAPSATGGRGRG
jgi:alkylated DNA repair dioxygenase AlkB